MRTVRGGRASGTPSGSAAERRLKIVSNFSFQKWLPEAREHLTFEDASEHLAGFLRQCLRADVVIVNGSRGRLLWACVLRRMAVRRRFRLISVDLVLRPPKTVAARIAAYPTRVLFQAVDRFILHFKDLRGYTRHYGIEPDRAVYVPFKVNALERIVARGRGSPDGEYVLCAGPSLRDSETFVAALRRTACPGVLLQQPGDQLAPHGTAPWSGDLPSNVRFLRDDSGSPERFMDVMAKARLIVIPRFRWDITATGISTYLVAMAMNKCVIISDGPGAGDVLTDQAVVVPPEDPERLAGEIARLWNDRPLREAIASRGYAYAMAAGGGERVLRDVLRASVPDACAAACCQ